MNITVVGTGYVGLVTGTCFAEIGNNVTCVDIDKYKVKQMREGQVPIYEPGLEELFHRNIAENRLSFTTDLAGGVKGAEIIFLALPTPPNDDGSADLSYILKVADDLAMILKNYTVVVDKSTVPVGTAEKVNKRINKNGAKKIDVVANPEFLREGFAVNDFMKPDRIVIGTSSDKAKKVMNELYGPFEREGSPIYFMDERSAEMTKYAANSFLATKVSFINEVANLCERVGADIDAVRMGIGADERIGKRFLMPGIGYGGSCFPKDVQALSKTAEDNGYDFRIIKSVMEVNEHQKKSITAKINRFYEKDIKDKTFALWGLAFKPDTDDIREAASIKIINMLTKSGAKVVAYDPEAMENVKKMFSSNSLLSFKKDMYEALDGADALIIATEWSEFRSPDFTKVKEMLSQPIIFDGRNIYSLEDVKKAGFYYESVGRSIVKQGIQK
jgi:UDPglucose 6-dehydrogenase